MNQTTTETAWPKKIVRDARKDVIKATKNRVAVSSIGDDARQLFLKYIGVFEEVIYAPSRKRMDLGTLVHTLWETTLRKLPILGSAEDYIVPHPTLPLRGRYDFVLLKPDTNEKYLLELKSTSQDYSTPLFSAVAQWGVYAERLGILKGFLVYDNVATTDETWFVMIRDGMSVGVYLDGNLVEDWPDLIQNLYDKVEYVVWCEKTKHRPEPCMSCTLAGKCKFPDKCDSLEQTYPVQITFGEWKETK